MLFESVGPSTLPIGHGCRADSDIFKCVNCGECVIPYGPIDLSTRLTEQHESGKSVLHGANETMRGPGRGAKNSSMISVDSSKVDLWDVIVLPKGHADSPLRRLRLPCTNQT